MLLGVVLERFWLYFGLVSTCQILTCDSEVIRGYLQKGLDLQALPKHSWPVNFLPATVRSLGTTYKKALICKQSPEAADLSNFYLRQ